MEEEFDEYEGLGTYTFNGRLGMLKGTLKYSGPDTPYDRDLGITRYRASFSAKQLVRLYLEGDTGFPCSQYRYWLESARDFLRGVTYSKKEHVSLLVRSFEVYLQRLED